MDFNVPFILGQDGIVGLLGQDMGFFKFVTSHWQFCLLHFLQFAIWGAWIVVLANMLNARGYSRSEIGRIYGTMPIGTMLTIIFVGALADKYLNTEVIIGVSHLIGAVLLFLMTRAKSARAFYWCALFYALFYAPTLGLVNSIVFAHDQDIFNGAAQQYFPWIRVFGTIGWIVAGLSHALILKKDEPVGNQPLLLACVLSIALGAFAFTLPETKPAGATAAADVEQTETEDGESDAAGATEEGTPDEGSDDAENTPEDQGIVAGSIEMLKAFPVFFGVAFVAAMAMGLYFAFAALFLEKTGVPPNVVGPTMTIGQWIEIFFMLTLPWFLTTLGMNWVLLIGLGAWAFRFALFSIGRPLPLVLVGIAIHGICFDFFFAAGMINADKIAPSHLTATAQALFGFLVYGLGMYLGSELSGWWNQRLSKPVDDAKADKSGEVETTTDWRLFWGVPCLIMVVATIVFLVSIM